LLLYLSAAGTGMEGSSTRSLTSSSKALHNSIPAGGVNGGNEGARQCLCFSKIRGQGSQAGARTETLEPTGSSLCSIVARLGSELVGSSALLVAACDWAERSIEIGILGPGLDAATQAKCAPSYSDASWDFSSSDASTLPSLTSNSRTVCSRCGDNDSQHLAFAIRKQRRTLSSSLPLSPFSAGPSQILHSSPPSHQACFDVSSELSPRYAASRGQFYSDLHPTGTLNREPILRVQCSRCDDTFKNVLFEAFGTARALQIILVEAVVPSTIPQGIQKHDAERAGGAHSHMNTFRRQHHLTPSVRLAAS
jgi:hypothetical protein